jgi:hypothetical protein
MTQGPFRPKIPNEDAQPRTLFDWSDRQITRLVGYLLGSLFTLCLVLNAFAF